MMGDGGLFAVGALVLLGTLTGFISGMLGIGGGTVVVPALVLGLPMLGIGGPELPKIAMATSLALVVPTSIASAQAHVAKGGVDRQMLMLLAPSIAAGAVLTAAFAAAINSGLVMVVFIVFALFTAWGLIRPRKSQTPIEDTRPSKAGVAVRGMAGGVLSSLLGLGVGFFAVPMLSRFVTMPHAIGTAAALALPMSIVGTTGYLLAQSPVDCMGQCTGYVYLPAVAAIGISAVLVAPMGAWAAHALPVAALRRSFAVFLIVAAGNLAYKTFPPEMIVAQSARLIALGKLVMAPEVTTLESSEAPSRNDREPAQTPYFALVQQYGPQRAFSPLIVARDEVGPTITVPLFGWASGDTVSGFDPAAMQAGSATGAAAETQQPTPPAVTALDVGRE